MSISTEFRGHEPADYLALGLSKPSRSLPHIKTPVHSATTVGAFATDLQRVLQSDLNRQASHDATNATRFIVDFDKLVCLLAKSATCLGPVPGTTKADADASIRGCIMLS